MEVEQKTVVRSSIYFWDIKAIFEYGEESLGDKVALYFY